MMMATDPGVILHQFITTRQGQSNDEVTRRYQTIMSKLPPDVAADANRFAFSQLPADIRKQLAAEYQTAHNDPKSPFDNFADDDDEAGASPHNLGRMSLKASDQDPDLLSGIFGKDSPLNSTLGRMILASVATYLIRRFLSGQGNTTSPNDSTGQTPQDPLGGLGGLLSEILNASGSAQGSTGLPPRGSTGLPQGGTSPSGAPDIGDLLGGLLGAAGGASAGSGRGQSSTPDIGDLLGGLLGAAGSGESGRGQSSTPDIGDLLGGLLGGAQGDAASPSQAKPSPLGSLRKDRK
jgi:hypothetical protein